MSSNVAALHRPRQASLPVLMFVSMLAHGVGILLMLVAPMILPGGKREPFGGPSGSGGDVMWVSTSNIGQIGKPSQKDLTQEEPAPSYFVKKATAPEDVPLPSKTTIPEPKKKIKEQPAAKETLNQPKRKIEGPYGRGTDTRKDLGKSGNQGQGNAGVGALGVGDGTQGGYGTGTGIPFPFPWYIENVIFKIEQSWQKPYLGEQTSPYLTVVYFVITRTGKVAKVEVEESSGIPSLDRSCESAILGAAPFPPLPNQWTESEIAFRLTFKATP